MNCKKCGKGLNPKDKVCSNCGEPVFLENSSNPKKINDEMGSRKQNRILIILLVVLVVIICVFLGYVFVIKYNNDQQITNNVKDNNNVKDDNPDDNNQVNNEPNSASPTYILNEQLAHIYDPITDTKIKIEDNIISPAIIIEIDENKNVGYYFEDCGQNCIPTLIDINDEHAKSITYVSQGYEDAFVYVILTEEGNIYQGNINGTKVDVAKKIEATNKFINITHGGYRVEATNKIGTVLGITDDSSYYNVIYCPNIKSGNYVAYVNYYSDSDPYDIEYEYILAYDDGSISYLNFKSSMLDQRCENYDYDQFVVNTNNEKIKAQFVFYKEGFYILATDGYLYKLTSTKTENNYVAELYNSNKVSKYSYNQEYARIDSITVDYVDNTNEVFDNLLSSGGVQIVMVERKNG
ncbi:MAG: zinc ribbon domain-containing protein [Bacilli bacterium]|nr:zinc ribbon domain-containing protein [Bacilli bacterium]